MATPLEFCPAETFGFDSKNCLCSKHREAFYARPEVQEGLRRAKQATVCEGPGASFEDDTPCPNTENLTPFLSGATDDEGIEIFMMLCPACVVMF